MDNFAFLKCTMCVMTCFQRKWEKITFQWRNLTNTTSARWSKSTSTVSVMLIACTLARMWLKWQFPSVVFLPKIHYLGLIMRRTWDKLPLRDILQSTWQVLLKTVKVIKNRENLIITAKRGLRRHDNLKLVILDGILEQKRSIKSKK